MKQGLVDTIKSRGYWRFNFQPLTIVRFETLQECFDLVEKSKVHLRGWDYPFIARREDNFMGEIREQNCIGTWIDSGSSKEFWRMYKSGQFLHYKSLREDWFADDGWTAQLAEQIKPNTSIGVIGSVIYEVTEAIEFVSRLIQNGQFKDGVKINITLYGIKDRALWFDTRDRVPFYRFHKSSIENYVYSKEFNSSQVLSESKSIATKIIAEILECFGWNPAKEQIEADQSKLLSKQCL